MIKELLHFWLRSLPLVLGMISVLTALAFLIAFTDRASFGNLEDEAFCRFVLFAFLGLPLTLFGINHLSNK